MGYLPRCRDTRGEEGGAGRRWLMRRQLKLLSTRAPVAMYGKSQEFQTRTELNIHWIERSTIALHPSIIKQPGHS